MSDPTLQPLLSTAARFGERGQPRPAGEVWAERLRALLHTRPGTLPWRPDYGIDLEWLLGRPLHALNVNLLRMRLRSVIGRWMPEVRVERLDVKVISDFEGLHNRDRTVPIAEAALLPYGAGGRIEIQLEVVTPAGPVGLDLELAE